ncbi:MAG: hypothetical protein JXD23_12755 [Spirochaetales bacterium]|nr:hypothetical protein [Spirochaetales bacterium]
MKRMMLGILFSGAMLVPAFGTNIKIPSLDLVTKIFGYNGQIVMQTQMYTDILIEGGYKFGGKIVVGFDGIMGFLDNPAYGQALPPLTFKSVSLDVRDLFGAPLSLSYFMGQYDYLCYGNDFPRLFGTADIKSTYRATYTLPGLAYEFDYRGIHRVDGTGIKLELTSPELPFGFGLYVYQDQNFVTVQPLFSAPSTPVVNLNYLFYNTGIFSSDLRFLINTEVFKMEAFAGGTIDTSTWSGYIRFGLLAYLGFGPVDFLFEAGVPQFDFVSGIGIDLLYALFESRLNLGPVTITPTVFMYPGQYLQQDTPDSSNRIDFNMSLSLFNPRRDPFSFGVEGDFVTYNLLSLASGFTYQLKVLPFISFATSGIYWEIKASMKLLDSAAPLTFDDMLASIQGLITVRAEF